MGNIAIIAALRISAVPGRKAAVILRIYIGRQIMKTINTGIRID